MQLHCYFAKTPLRFSHVPQGDELASDS